MKYGVVILVVLLLSSLALSDICDDRTGTGIPCYCVARFHGIGYGMHCLDEWHDFYCSGYDNHEILLYPAVDPSGEGIVWSRIGGGAASMTWNKTGAFERNDGTEVCVWIIWGDVIVRAHSNGQLISYFYGVQVFNGYQTTAIPNENYDSGCLANIFKPYYSTGTGSVQLDWYFDGQDVPGGTGTVPSSVDWIDREWPNEYTDTGIRNFLELTRHDGMDLEDLLCFVYGWLEPPEAFDENECGM